jgi:uncharacterized protein YciI
MRYILILLSVLFVELSFAQSNLPDFLTGTWKMENNEIYEHWDKLNDSSLKGISYKLKDGQMTVSEYLEINEIKKKITYKATVINQNHGKDVCFKLTKTGNTLTFENAKHDFPKKIVYQQLNENEIFVQLSDGMQKVFEYKLQKQFQKTTTNDSTVLNPNYDPILAEKLGSDNFGMKSYLLIILKTGANKTTDKTFINNCFRGHMENINLLVKQGKMIVAGPLGKNDNKFRGIFILNLNNIEEAKILMQNDTAIKEGLLDFDIYNWYGSAALPEYLKLSDKIWKVKP